LLAFLPIPNAIHQMLQIDSKRQALEVTAHIHTHALADIVFIKRLRRRQLIG
jgi:hypothetical protein